MRTTIILTLVILWALGMISSFPIGRYVHLLLVLAIVLAVIGVIKRSHSA